MSETYFVGGGGGGVCVGWVGDWKRGKGWLVSQGLGARPRPTHAHTSGHTHARTHARSLARTHTHTYRIAHWTHQPCNIAFTHCKIHAAPPMPQGIPTLLPSTCIPRFPEVQMMKMLHRMQCTTQCDTTQCNTMFRRGGGETQCSMHDNAHARQCACHNLVTPLFCAFCERKHGWAITCKHVD